MKESRKVLSHHLDRAAYLYIRQSSMKQGNPSANGVFCVSLVPRIRVVGGGDGTQVRHDGRSASLDAVG